MGHYGPLHPPRSAAHSSEGGGPDGGSANGVDSVDDDVRDGNGKECSVSIVKKERSTQRHGFISRKGKMRKKTGKNLLPLGGGAAAATIGGGIPGGGPDRTFETPGGPSIIQ